MTTYRCLACGTGVEVEEIEEFDVVKVKPCEVCLNVVEEESHEKGKAEGHASGFQAGYENGYDKGSEEGELKGYRDWTDKSLLIQKWTQSKKEKANAKSD